MKLLGGLLAGGASRRFGSDKAMALLAGRSLLDHAVRAMAGQCDALVLLGGPARPPWPVLPDATAQAIGPAGAVLAGLNAARAGGFDALFTSAVDTPFLPADAAARLQATIGNAHAVFAESQPTIALWRVSARADVMRAIRDGRVSLQALVAAAGGHAVPIGTGPISNINTQAELARLRPL